MLALGFWYAVGGLGGLVVFVKWIWPPIRDFFGGLKGAIENVNGRPAKYDKAQREVKPAVPSLSVQLADLHKAVSDQTEQNRRITDVEALVVEHGQRLTAIETGHQIERSLGHVAQAATFDAMGRAIDAGRRRDDEPDEPGPDL